MMRRKECECNSDKWQRVLQQAASFPRDERDAPHPLLIVTRTHFSRTRSPSCGARIDSNPMVISALIGAITADIGAAIAIGIDGSTAVADASNGACRVKRI
jgi:hypothetical protein